ncbi:MAG: hypothetical protein AAF402_01865 [Pseudomonadota bacterium]
MTNLLHRPLLIACVCLMSLSISAMAFAESHSENGSEVVVEEIETGQPETSIKEDASQAWDSTKKTVVKTGQAANQKGAEILDASKVGVAKGADYVSEKSSKAWDATKQGASKAAEATGSAASKAWEKTKEVTKNAVDFAADKLGDSEGGEAQVEERVITE